MKVNADTITDEQIRELHRDAESLERNDVYLARLCTFALGWVTTSDGMRRLARERCAAAWNARHGGES